MSPKRPVLIACAIAFVLFPASASSQDDCHLGVYFNVEGTQISTYPIRDLGSPLLEMEVYYVLRVDHLVSGVAWNRTIEPSDAVINTVQHYDPMEQFLEVTPDGFRLGLGGCRDGYSDQSIFVLHETLILQNHGFFELVVQVEPNVLEDSEQVVFTDCTATAEKWRCSGMGTAFVPDLDADGESWGRVKAIFRGE